MYSWVFAINWNTLCPLQLPMRTTPLGKCFLFLKHSNAHGITLPIPTRALRVYHVQCFCQEPTLSLITKKDLSKRVWLGLYLWVYFCLLFLTRGSRFSSLAPSDGNGPLCYGDSAAGQCWGRWVEGWMGYSLSHLPVTAHLHHWYIQLILNEHLTIYKICL